MAPKSSKRKQPSTDPHGMFSGIVVFLVESGVQARRLQIWKQKLEQMGATIEERLTKRVTHILAMSSEALHQQLGSKHMTHFKGKVLSYQWIEDSLRLGEKVSEESYILKENSETKTTPKMHEEENSFANSSSDEQSHHKRLRYFPEDSGGKSEDGLIRSVLSEAQDTARGSNDLSNIQVPVNANLKNLNLPNQNDDVVQPFTPYNPPDLNKDITEIFGKLINIYRALGDDRRSFSYYKAITVIEKLTFKIESADQVKDLPSIGKSMKDHIQEIVTTGKLSKLEHFEKDEKVRTISLFGEVWGIGPATALKLYDKGHRILDDLKNEDTLTNSQRLGLKYFHDIKTRIPRHEVQVMEEIVQKAGEDILPGVVIICGGSYRRGKASCGDMDIVITHTDEKSHKGFLPKFVKRLKEMNFLREDLVFRVHSEEGTDSGVDTYFGLCTYLGRELRHRIDFKVYPRDIFAFGLIAWTGNDVLNRRLRLLAESKGYRLDDTGLFLATQGSGGKRGTKTNTKLHFNTEREVFDFLGFPWLEPHQRNL